MIFKESEEKRTEKGEWNYEDRINVNGRTEGTVYER